MAVIIQKVQSVKMVEDTVIYIPMPDWQVLTFVLLNGLNE